MNKPIKLQHLTHGGTEDLREAHNHLVDAINLLSERLYLLESSINERDLRRPKVVHRDRREADPL